MYIQYNILLDHNSFIWSIYIALILCKIRDLILTLVVYFFLYYFFLLGYITLLISALIYCILNLNMYLN